MANRIGFGLCGNGVVGTNAASPCDLCGRSLTSFAANSLCSRRSTSKFVALFKLPLGIHTVVLGRIRRGGGWLVSGEFDRVSALFV